MKTTIQSTRIPAPLDPAARAPSPGETVRRVSCHDAIAETIKAAAGRLRTLIG